MSQALKVGLFAVVALVILGGLVLTIEDVDLFGEPGFAVEASFDSVAGLDDKSAVRIAGVRVGQVDGIRLDGQRAVVHLVLDQDVGLTEGTLARIANMGLLGDKYILLEPGPQGSPLLAQGSIIPGITPPTIDQAIAQLSEIGESIGGLAGPEGLGGGGIERLISNLEAVSGDIRELVAANRGQIESTIANVETFSGTLARELPALTRQVEAVLARTDAAVAEMQGTIGESRPDVAAALDNLRRLSEDARVSVANLNQVTGRLAEGEGTIGKLLTTDELHDTLVTTLDSVNSGVEGLSDTLGTIQRVQVGLGLESFYLEGIEETRSAFHLDIDTPNDPGEPDWRYRVGVVDSPFGNDETTTRTVTVTSPDGSASTTTVETREVSDDYTLSALLGLPPFRGGRLYVGLIESSGGAALEVPLLDRQALLSVEAFDFDRPNDLEPHLRLSGKYFLNGNVYLVGGYDDFLAGDRESIFLGGGIRWEDDTLKYLLGSVPSF
jgi:phospholipid/cholesterol/gamma-HCH transport system substrate-binding protein